MPPLTLLETLRSHPEVNLAILFGSMASGRARADSDVDIAVMGPAPLTAQQKLDLIADLTDATGRPVDLIDLRVAGEPVLGQILQHGQLLLGDDQAFGALLSRHLVDAADFMPYADRILAERRQRWIGR